MVHNRFKYDFVGHYIDGRFVPSVEGEEFVSINPATGEILCKVARGKREDIELAVNAAERALHNPEWCNLTIKARAQILREIGLAITEAKQELAHLESLDTGKPISETLTGDIPRAANNFLFFSDLLETSALTEFVKGEDGSVHQCQREPIGICGSITPWNLPMYLETWKVAPALAMGNTVVLKPAELTPLTAAALAQITSECGLPNGVLNIVQGFGEGEAGEALVAHPKVKCISFTGETNTGKAIMRTAAEHLKKLSFELGGKGASIVFADADIETAVPTVARAAFRNQGQVCLAGSRLIVEASIADKFMDALVKEVKKIKIGEPTDEKTTMGALISAEHRDRVLDFIKLAKQESAKIICGGNIPEYMPKRGSFLEPTIITNVTQNSRLIQQEIFGPVLTVQTFKTAEEAVELANGTQYGLSASVWTKDEVRMESVTRQIRCGLVWKNCWFVRNLNVPFGGMKASGIGREGGRHSFDFYSEWKTISAAK